MLISEGSVRTDRPGHILEDMTDLEDKGIRQALSLTRQLFSGTLRNDNGESTSSLVVTGPPCSGKTSFALASLLEGIEIFGVDNALMVVSGRQAAAHMSRKVIESRGVVDQSRPVGTLSALAFRLLNEDHRAKHLPIPKLLNGAEQETLLRNVLAQHVQHVLRGDSCESCGLLRKYYGNVPSWVNMLTGRDLQQSKGTSGEQYQSGAFVRSMQQSDGGLDSLPTLSDAIRADFVAQLRDTLARINELGLEFDDEQEVIDALQTTMLPEQERSSLEIQWRLAFSLWREYAEHIESTYPDEARLDSSRLLVEAAQAVRSNPQLLRIPKLLVVDDWQDVTLAGMSLLQALSESALSESAPSESVHKHGCSLILVGNSDEAVQVFRGSYPEYLDLRITTGLTSQQHAEVLNMDNAQRAHAHLFDNACQLGHLNAKRILLPARPLLDAANVTEQQSHSYLDLVAARVSLSIPSEEQENTALPRRPGKLPQWEGSLPIRKLSAKNGTSKDGSIQAHLFHTPEEELAHVVWQIKHESLANDRDWNDMAVIAHDNVTVESFGQRLRQEGVPVRYSSVTRPLREEPVVQGLFALIELAERRCNTHPGDVAGSTQTIPDSDTQAQWIRNRIRAVLSSPLVMAKMPEGAGERPVRLQRLDMLMDSCVALAKLDNPTAYSDASSSTDRTDGEKISVNTVAFNDKIRDQDNRSYESSDASKASQLMLVWKRLHEGIEAMRQQRFDERGIVVDDSLTATGRSRSQMKGALNRSSIYAVLLLSEQQDRENLLNMMDAIASKHGHDADVDALRHLCDILHKVCSGISALDISEPEYVLWQAWDACGLASEWQRESLSATHRGELANDRLDAMMRLFQFASGTQTFNNIDAFITQVSGMQIEADSLAHIGPVEHAVTLTTPAGAAAEAQRWPLVWLPTLQEGVWPNVTQRDTLFGTEDLADLVMRFHDVPAGFVFSSAGGRLRSTLHAEKKNMLMALSRASQQAIWSAVWNEDTVPSDFLFGYLPELCPRVNDATHAQFTEVGSYNGEHSDFGGLELSPRGLITVARSVLLRASMSEATKQHSHGNTVDMAPGGGPTKREIEDASRTLRLLDSLGYQAANPDSWAFLYRGDMHHGEVEQQMPISDSSTVLDISAAADEATVHSLHTAEHPTAESTITVTLSPSAVDSIWQCPLEWALGRQLSGPQPGSIYMSFGTVVHHVAQLASEQGLDKAESIDEGLQHQGEQTLIDSRTDAMMALYKQLSHELSSPPNYQQNYDLLRRDASARKIMSNIASYFVRSVQKNYAQSGKAPIDVGQLESVECELPFTARLTFSEILSIWNATYGDEYLLELPELCAVMSALVGGFPAQVNTGLAVQLSGRIDRLEHRILNGQRVTRLVDYKTGKGHSRREVFSDLQLVCYQLGQYFGAGDSSNGDVPQSISQAVLFDVAVSDAPATSRAEESSYQPALMRDGKFNSVFVPRTGSPTIDASYKPDELPEETPPGVSERVWSFVRQQCGQQGIWALTMISRVFFAAGVKLSLSSDLAQFNADRCHKGGSEGCPAWKALHNSVMEDKG